MAGQAYLRTKSLAGRMHRRIARAITLVLQPQARQPEFFLFELNFSLVFSIRKLHLAPAPHIREHHAHQRADGGHKGWRETQTT